MSDQDISAASAGGNGDAHNAVRTATAGASSTGANATGATAAGASSVGFTALLAVAGGAVALGAVAVGRLVIRRAVIHQLRVDELEIGHLRVGRLELTELGAGGYVIIDDFMIGACRAAVLDYRERHHIDGPIYDIDGWAVVWKKGERDRPRRRRPAPRPTRRTR